MLCSLFWVKMSKRLNSSECGEGKSLDDGKQGVGAGDRHVKASNCRGDSWYSSSVIHPDLKIYKPIHCSVNSHLSSARGTPAVTWVVNWTRWWWSRWVIVVSVHSADERVWRLGFWVQARGEGKVDTLAKRGVWEERRLAAGDRMSYRCWSLRRHFVCGVMLSFRLEEISCCYLDFL